MTLENELVVKSENRFNYTVQEYNKGICLVNKS